MNIGISCLLANLVLTVATAAAQADSPPAVRQVAITIDDLPAASVGMSPAQIKTMTERILAALHQHNAPAVGFVNEQRIYRLGELDERVAALRLWVDGGFELGNHTFNHTSLNRTNLQVWEDDVVRGENFTRLLLGTRNLTLRYFRHPYLDTGRDLQTRRAADAFLTARGYRIAPVTLDAWDWMFSRVYEDAQQHGDTALQKKVADAYIAHSSAMFAYDEKLSKQTIGYEPRQILLLHANSLEADHIGELLDMMRARGYRFITLEDALSDQAYGLPDTYIGEEGAGWIEHWAIALGKPPQNSPAVPQWILDRGQALESTQP